MTAPTTLSLDPAEIRAAVPTLHAGMSVRLSGILYTARDAAHMRLLKLIENGDPLPFPLEGATIYYAGPTPTPPGKIIGSCGPTTASRMDRFTPRLLSLGLVAMIGKGERSETVNAAIRSCGAVYFCAVGGAGALISKSVRSVQEIAFPDLGCESVKRLVVEDFSAVVAVDSFGGNVFRERREQMA